MFINEDIMSLWSAIDCFYVFCVYFLTCDSLFFAFVYLLKKMLENIGQSLEMLHSVKVSEVYIYLPQLPTFYVICSPLPLF